MKRNGRSWSDRRISPKTRKCIQIPGDVWETFQLQLVCWQSPKLFFFVWCWLLFGDDDDVVAAAPLPPFQDDDSPSPSSLRFAKEPVSFFKTSPAAVFIINSGTVAGRLPSAAKESRRANQKFKRAVFFFFFLFLNYYFPVDLVVCLLPVVPARLFGS